MVSRFPALPRGHRNPAQIYYAISAVSSFCFSLSFTVNIIYHATTVGLNPIQLILVGTVLESTCYVFEIPTGVVADRYSRRLSVIIGFAMIGVGIVIEGSLPVFATVLMAQVIWGIGSTFTSGATQAWIIDEIGENQAAHVLTGGQQIFVAAAFTGTLASGGLSLLGDSAADRVSRHGLAQPRYRPGRRDAREQLHSVGGKRRRRLDRHDHYGEGRA
jgi:MFS family permease